MSDLRSSMRAADVTSSDERGYDRQINAHRSSLVDGLAKAPRISLGDIQDRVRSLENYLSNLTHGINEIGHKLRDHADGVYGELPMARAATTEVRPPILEPMPTHEGAMGSVYAQLSSLEAVLHQLDEAQSYVAFQAGRNTTLV